MKKIIFIGVLIVFTMSGYSIDKKHPIDIQIDKLIEYAQSDNAQVQVYNKGYNLWDKELNTVFQKLKKLLENDPTAIKNLKDAQISWIKFRDDEFAFLSKIYEKLEGTMYLPMQANDRMLVVRARVIELMERLASLEE